MQSLETMQSDVQHLGLHKDHMDKHNSDLFDEIFGKMVTTPDKMNTISTGQIEKLDVPAGWVRRDDVQLRSGANLIEFHPPESNEIRLNSFYRGSRVSPDSAKAFKDCLDRPPHSLKADEISSLAQVLMDKAHDFNILSAKTQDLNGKRVLLVEGRYRDPDKTTSQTIYVDTDGTGSAVQEISYTAPGPDYQSNLVKAQTAIKSIVWKK